MPKKRVYHKKTKPSYQKVYYAKIKQQAKQIKPESQNNDSCTKYSKNYKDFNNLKTDTEFYSDDLSDSSEIYAKSSQKNYKHSRRKSSMQNSYKVHRKKRKKRKNKKSKQDPKQKDQRSKSFLDTDSNLEEQKASEITSLPKTEKKKKPYTIIKRNKPSKTFDLNKQENLKLHQPNLIKQKSKSNSTNQNSNFYSNQHFIQQEQPEQNQLFPQINNPQAQTNNFFDQQQPQQQQFLQAPLNFQNFFMNQQNCYQQPVIGNNDFNLQHNGYQNNQNQAVMQFQNQNFKPKFEINVKPRKKQFSTIEEKIQFKQDYTKKIKTETCKNFDAKGWCKFGDKCSFAHGKHQLRQKTYLNPLFKTRPCKAYHVQGICEYGRRCQYQHEEVIVLDTKNYHNCKKNSLIQYVNQTNNVQFSYESLLNYFDYQTYSNNSLFEDFEQLPKRNRLPIFINMKA